MINRTTIIILGLFFSACGEANPALHVSRDMEPGDVRKDTDHEADMSVFQDMKQPADLGLDLGDAGPDMNPAPSWQCPAQPVCDGANPNTSEHKLVEADGCAFKLVPWSAQAVQERDELIDALGLKSAGVSNISGVLNDLNRSGVDGITANNAERLKNHDWRGFRWNSGDNGVDYWYPQGITGSSDATESGLINGKKTILASWYHKTEDSLVKGVRVSLADTTDLDNVKYRHLLLVEPKGSQANPSFGPVLTGSGGALHAGGMVWWGERLFVADTTRGIRVFDLSRVMKVKNTDKDLVGVSGAEFHGFGYAYVVPESMRFTLASDTCPIRFSFLGLDRSSNPPAFVSGEYKSDTFDRRLAVWDLDESTGLLEVRQGESRATAAYVSGQARMQGATRYEGNIYISSSSQAGSFGRLYRTRPGYGESAISAWVYGAEDLYMERTSDTIWTAAEHPDNRDVVGIPLRPPP